MKEKTKGTILTVIGIFFIVFGLMAIIVNLLLDSPQQILWFCYWALLLLGIGTIRKNSFLLAAQLNVMTIPLLIWNVDFFYFWITKEPLIGIANYFFIDRPLVSQIISIQHLITIPLAFYALSLIKIKRK